MKGRVLFKKGRLYIPDYPELKVRILYFVHASPIVGHSGFHKSLYRARSDFCWPGMKTKIKKFTKKCEIRQKNKIENAHPGGLLQPLPIPQTISTNIFMDFVEGLPISKGY